MGAFRALVVCLLAAPAAVAGCGDGASTLPGRHVPGHGGMRGLEATGDAVAIPHAWQGGIALASADVRAVIDPYTASRDRAFTALGAER